MARAPGAPRGPSLLGLACDVRRAISFEDAIAKESRIREVAAHGRKLRVKLTDTADGVRAELVDYPRAGTFAATNEAAVLAFVLRFVGDCQPQAGKHFR